MKKWFGLVILVVLLIGLGLRSPFFKKGKELPEFGRTAGEFVLGDFESEEALKNWEAKGVLVFLTEQYAVRGRHSASLNYSDDGNPVFALEQYFRTHEQARDWRPYEELLFTVFNPGQTKERIGLQVKDGSSRRYKEDIVIPANSALSHRLPMKKIAPFVDLRDIAQLNFFRWDPKKTAVFFLDDVRLIPQPQEAPKKEGKTTEAFSFDGSIRPTSPNAVSGQLFHRYAEKWEVTENGETFLRIPLRVAQDQSFLFEGTPVSGGIPFPYGLLKATTSFKLRTAGGTELPIQIRPLAFWEDGSVKWLHVNTEGTARAADQGLFFEIHKSPPSKPNETPLKVTQDSGQMTVVTGPLKFSVNKAKFTLLEEVFLDRNGDGQFSPEEKVAQGGDLFIRHRDEMFRSSLSRHYTLAVEEIGPLRVTLKASGWFTNESGRPFCQYEVRIQAFSGKSDIRLFHTLIYTGYPANRYHHEYENVKLPENETIEEIGIEQFISEKGIGRYQVGLPEKALTGTFQKPLVLSQLKADGFQLNQGEKTLHQGEKALGWLHAASESFGVTVNVRDFWQQYPKEIHLDPAGKLTVSLWPRSAGVLNLETGPAAEGPDAVARGSAFGLAKTHELTFSYHPGWVDPQTLHPKLSLWQHPPLLHSSPEWVYATYALGSIGPYSPLLEEEELLKRLFDWAARQPERFGWYGMLDYGDTLFWYRKEGYDKSYPDWGWHPEGRWGWFNCEGVGTHTGALFQFIRTGDYRYFAFGEASARHIMDVDTIHYDTVANDPRLRGKIIGDHSRVGAMHRHNANHWGGRADEASHTHPFGFLLYYYLTGNERALEVAKEVGSYFLGRPITYTRHPDIAPQRAIANVLWGDVLLYEATRKERFKKEADHWAALFVNGQREDGGWGENYNPQLGTWDHEAGMRFMIFHTLPALIAYHRLTGSPEVEQAIIKGTEHLMAHEDYLPFFDSLAYAYELTGEVRYLDEARRRLSEQVAAQDRSGDPMKDGMLFEKFTYDRVPPLLYNTPYLFGVRNPKLLEAYRKAMAEEPEVHPKTGYTLFFASPLERVFRDTPVSKLQRANPIQIALAVNESESYQIVLAAGGEDLKGVRLDAGPLIHQDGISVIGQNQIRLHPVGYVPVKKSDHLKELEGLVPDPLLPMEPFEVKKGTLQPVWVTVTAPPGTLPGEYEGSLTLSSENAPFQKIALRVRVWAFELPKQPHLKTAFDFYRSRLVQAYESFFPEWWEKWKGTVGKLEERYFEAMLRYRISPVLNIDPARREDIRKVLRLRMQGLNAFAIGPYSGSHGNNWPDDLTQVIPRYREYGRFLRDYGLLEDAYLYTYDEPKAGTEKVATVSRAVHEADPGLKNLVAFHQPFRFEEEQEWFRDIDIVCIRNVIFDPKEAEKIRKAGKELWIYCSGPSFPYPTFVIDYPTMAYRILPWMCWKYNVSGLLYWCVNFWTKNPYLDPVNTQWEQNGNGSLFYPGPEGPVGSIRLEIIRDGIEDYDMLAILSERLKGARSDGSVLPAVLRQAEDVLLQAEHLTPSMEKYPQDPETLLSLREKIAEAIQSLGGNR